MGFLKRGVGSVTKAEATEKTKTATVDPTSEWTEEDERELQAENAEADKAGE